MADQTEAEIQAEACAICLCEMEVGDKVRKLGCMHQFHAKCVDKWLLKFNSVCPICKMGV